MQVKNFTYWLLFVGALSLSCGPDARHDNPLDPINGRGVSGTVYQLYHGGKVSGATVTARPGNKSAVSDAQGYYQLDLSGEQRYLITVHHPLYNDTTDTIDVPSDGRLEANFMIAGRSTITRATVNTEAIVHQDGIQEHNLLICCLGVNPEGIDYLKDLSVIAQINSRSFIADPNNYDSFSIIYEWILTWDMIYPGVAFEETLLVGKSVVFNITATGGTTTQQVGVPQFLHPAENLTPNSGDSLAVPGYFCWDNVTSGLYDITVEVWDGTVRRWSASVNNIDSVRFDDASIEQGSYTWRVVTTDSTGNRAMTEAVFTRK
jgi:hypothetical protein